MHEIAQKNLFFQCVAGSHAYGMNTPTSDMDYRGLFYANKKSILTPFFPVEQVEGFGGEKDSVVYEVWKFMDLLVQQNPNILELLWIEDNFVKRWSPQYGLLRNKREELLSSKAKFTFSGYAHAQLQRIKGHNKWINNPQPKIRPKEIDFVSVVWNNTAKLEYNNKLPSRDVMKMQGWNLGGGILGLIVDDNGNWFDNHEAILLKDIDGANPPKNFDFIAKFNKELYRSSVDNWKHYWDWVTHRNETRSKLEAKFGFDTKHGAHLIRLLRMGKEILTEGVVHVFRSDARELLEIRNGAVSYEKLVEMANTIQVELEPLYEKTSLRKSVDLDTAADLLSELYEMSWKP